MNKQPKVIIWDIETLGLKANDPILCVAWKELGQKTIHFRAAWQYKPTWDAMRTAKTLKEIEKSFQNIDRPFLKDVYEELSTADALVGHFEGYFDIPFLKSRLLKHKIGYLPKHIVTDTWRAAKNHLCLRSNRLFALNEYFNLPNKYKQNDLSLWTAVKTGNKDAFRIMEEYNRRDVTVTEALLKRLGIYAKLPLARQTNDQGEDRRVCVVPGCGGTLASAGIRQTATGSYRKLKCRKCKAYAKGMARLNQARFE